MSYIYRCIIDDEHAMIKVNWTKQEQETPKFWINQIIIFLRNIAVNIVKDEMSDINFIGKNTFFLENTLITFANLIKFDKTS